MQDSQDLYQKVAQFLINVRTNKPREMICHYLILSTLAEEEGEFGVNQTVRKIQEKWKVTVPAERVSKGLKSLDDSNMVKKQEGKYFMDTQQKERYRQSVANRVVFFEEVEQAWIESMQRINKCRELTEAEKQVVTGDFRRAVSTLCDKHVERIIGFLSGGTTELEHTFVSREIIDCVPDHQNDPGEIATIEKTIFPLFFRDADEQRAKYVSGIAQAYLRRTILEVETRGKDIFDAGLKSLCTYLDTNMVFSLLGLDGLERKSTAEYLVSMHKSLGVKTLVDQRSIQEFKSVLDRSRAANMGPRIPRGIFPEVKKAILEPKYKPDTKFALPDDAFVLLFWASLDEGFAKTAGRKQIASQWERFLNHLESVDIILSTKYGIKIVRESPRFVPNRETLEPVIDLVLEAANKAKLRKTHTTAEHDATMFFLISGLREGETPEFLPSNYWLISADRSLREFRRRMLKDDKQTLSYFVPVASWTELLMPFLTIQLVDEKDDAVAIAKTLGEGFEYFEVNRIPPRDVAEVLQRVPESYEKGPELVLRCAANRHFRETVASAVSRGGTSKEDIDEAVIEAFKSMQGQAELADKELIRGIEDRVKREKELENRLKKERQARKKAEKELQRTNRMIRIGRQIVLALILLVPAALATWAGYMVTKPQLFPISMDGVA
jgi:hypothetical protein